MSDKLSGIDFYEPIIVTFGVELDSVYFWQGDKLIDPRVVLTGLAAGLLQVVFSQELGTFGHTPPRHYVRTQTWEIVAKQTEDEQP